MLCLAIVQTNLTHNISQFGLHQSLKDQHAIPQISTQSSHEIRADFPNQTSEYFIPDFTSNFTITNTTIDIKGEPEDDNAAYNDGMYYWDPIFEYFENPYLSIPNFTILNVSVDYIDVTMMLAKHSYDDDDECDDDDYNDDDDCDDDCDEITAIIAQADLFSQQIQPIVKAFVYAMIPDQPDRFLSYDRFFPGLELGDPIGTSCYRIYTSYLHANGFSYPHPSLWPINSFVPLCLLQYRYSEDEIITQIYEEAARSHGNSSIIDERRNFVIPEPNLSIGPKNISALEEIHERCKEFFAPLP